MVKILTSPVQGDVPFGGHKATGLADPTAAQDASTKAYVDAVAQGLSVKASVRAASTANIASQSGLLTVDGVTLVDGDRVLAKDQTTGSTNGIWVAHSGAWTRAADADAAAELVGAFVFVEEGATNAGSGWVQTAAAPITVGTTTLTWTQFSGAGQIVAGAGLAKAGNTLRRSASATGYANLAALPSAAANNGLLERTADGGIYESDGSAWQPVRDPSGTYAALQQALSPRIAPPHAWPRTVVENFASGSAWTFVSANAASGFDTSVHAPGFAQSAHLVTNPGVTSAVRKTGLTAADLTGKAVEFMFMVDTAADLANITDLGVYIGTGGFSGYFVPAVFRAGAANQPFVPGEWYRVRVNVPAVATAGTPNVAAITDWQFYVNSTATASVHLQQVGYAPSSGGTLYPNGLISITFDDSWESVLTNAVPKLEQYGYRASNYVMVETIGTTNHQTLSDLQFLRDVLGWEIGGHAFTNAAHAAVGGLTSLSPSDLETEVANLKGWLQANGFMSEGFAYPQGIFNTTTDQVLRRYFSYARTTAQRPEETFPPVNPMRMRGYIIGGDGTGSPTTAQFHTLVDNCKANKDWLILAFHDVSNTPSSGSYATQTFFNACIDYIASSGVAVRRVSDVLRSL